MIGVKQSSALDGPVMLEKLYSSLYHPASTLSLLCEYLASTGVLGACRNAQADIEFPSLIMTPPVKKIFHDVSVVHLAIDRAPTLSCDIRQQFVEAKPAPMEFSCYSSAPQLKKA